MKGKHITKAERKRHATLMRILMIIMFLLIIIAALLAHSYRSAKASLSVTFTDGAPSVEYGLTLASMDFVSGSSGDVSASAEFLDTDTLGTKDLIFTVTKKMYGGLLKPSRDFTLTYNVIDTVPPVILWNGDGSLIKLDSTFDVNDYVAYGDNADPAPSLAVAGQVDVTKAGKYPLHVTVTDSSGNPAECDFTIKVVDEIPSSPDDTEPTKFKKFVKSNKGEGRSFGIDISTWQGDIDFNAVKEAGCDYVIIRIGYSINGEVSTDSKFDQNFEKARAAGLKVGIYLYSYDNTTDEAKASADWVIEKLAGAPLDLPVAFDWEDFTNFQSYEFTFTELNRMYDTFAETLSTAGYNSILYSSRKYLDLAWDHTDTRPIWLAHYTDQTDYTGPYKIWQATSTGKISGIDGPVDIDIMYN